MSSDAVAIVRVGKEIVEAIDRLTGAVEESTSQASCVSEQLDGLGCEVHKLYLELSLTNLRAKS